MDQPFQMKQHEPRSKGREEHTVEGRRNSDGVSSVLDGNQEALRAVSGPCILSKGFKREQHGQVHILKRSIWLQG